MKAFEVKKSVTGRAKNETKIVFVSADNKKQLKSINSVLKVWDRPDMKPEECPMEIIDGVICEK